MPTPAYSHCLSVDGSILGFLCSSNLWYFGVEKFNMRLYTIARGNEGQIRSNRPGPWFCNHIGPTFLTSTVCALNPNRSLNLRGIELVIGDSVQDLSGLNMKFLNPLRNQFQEEYQPYSREMIIGIIIGSSTKFISQLCGATPAQGGVARFPGATIISLQKQSRNSLAPKWK